MADGTAGDKSPWRWVGTVSAILAIAAFFGIHNFDQLKSAFGASNSGSSRGGSAAGGSPESSCDQLKTILGRCGVHFSSSGGWHATGKCDESSCPLSETFENDGTATGSGTVTFHIHAGNGFGTETGSSCTAVIARTPPKELATASCTIYSPDYGGEKTFGITDEIDPAN